MGGVGGLWDFSVRPSPFWILDFNCFGFWIGIRSRDTGLGTLDLGLGLDNKTKYRLYDSHFNAMIAL